MNKDVIAIVTCSQCRLMRKSRRAVPRLDLKSNDGFNLALVFPPAFKEWLDYRIDGAYEFRTEVNVYYRHEPLLQHIVYLKGQT